MQLGGGLGFRGRQLASPSGTKNTEAPASSTAIVFSATPPTAETLPYWSISPVAATIRFPVRRPLVSLSMIPNVMASPAEGPPMFSVCTVTSMGKSQLCWVSGWMPRTTVCLKGVPHPVTTEPWRAASVIGFCTTGPATKSPTSLIEDSSTLNVTVVPGL